MVAPRKRPVKTTKCAEKLLKRDLMKNPRLTAGLLEKSHPKLLENVLKQAIQQRLQKELDLLTFKHSQKPLLTKPMVKKKFAFARKSKKWTEEQWSRVFLVTRAPSSVSDLGLNGSGDHGILTAMCLCILKKHCNIQRVWWCWELLVVLGYGQSCIFCLRNTPCELLFIFMCWMIIYSLFHDLHSYHTFMEESAPCHMTKKKSDQVAGRTSYTVSWLARILTGLKTNHELLEMYEQSTRNTWYIFGTTADRWYQETVDHGHES